MRDFSFILEFFPTKYKTHMSITPPFILQTKQSCIYMNCLLVLFFPCLLCSPLSLSSPHPFLFSSYLCFVFVSPPSPSPPPPYIYPNLFAVLSPCQKRSLTTDNSLPFLLLNPYTTFRYCLHAKFPRNLTLLNFSS